MGMGNGARIEVPESSTDVPVWPNQITATVDRVITCARLASRAGRVVANQAQLDVAFGQRCVHGLLDRLIKHQQGKATAHMVGQKTAIA